MAVPGYQQAATAKAAALPAAIALYSCGSRVQADASRDAAKREAGGDNHDAGRPASPRVAVGGRQHYGGEPEIPRGDECGLGVGPAQADHGGGEQQADGDVERVAVQGGCSGAPRPRTASQTAATALGKLVT